MSSNNFESGIKAVFYKRLASVQEQRLPSQDGESSPGDGVQIPVGQQNVPNNRVRKQVSFCRIK
jgi:hypothetical protein